MKYEAVIGMEIHVQLNTKSKIFCSCDNDARGKAPNTTICPVCTGQPGTLPVLNRRAVELALRAGLALNAKIATRTKFDRKNYFYPDLPKGYQITQFDEPIIGKGEVSVPLGDGEFTVRITRAHLEEDAGKLTHPAGSAYSLVDLNRAGTPLIEIVSEPDIRTPAQAKVYAQEVYNLMRYAGVSDADLYHGNMRFDVNISVRPEGSEVLGTRAEVKNLNSFRAVEKAAEYEYNRQVELLENGHEVIQETRGWDDAKSKTFSQRSKEEAHDYRYFPEPDLPPLVITDQIVEEAKRSMPMMPGEIRRILKENNFFSSEIETIVSNMSSYTILKVLEKAPKNAKTAAHWMITDVPKFLESSENMRLPSDEELIDLAEAYKTSKLSSSGAKAVLKEIMRDTSLITYKTSFKSNILETAEKLGLIQVSDEGAIGSIVKRVIEANPKPVADYRAGQENALKFLVGQVMKESKGAANPQVANELILKELGK
jgi:aspartyl-tRNA(Asn)/glutamyl-tRNA(Gln) amidotransferase subunit B